MGFRQYLYTFVAQPRLLMADEALVKSAFDVSGASIANDVCTLHLTL